MVSENHGGAPASVREPPPSCQAKPSHRSQFMADVFAVNSGYRTRYPHVAVATNCSTGREDGRP